jgi:opacity protein-like surface antigen
MNKPSALWCAVMFSGISCAFLPLMGEAQTTVQEDPAKDADRTRGSGRAGEVSGAGDTERARAAEAERRRMHDEQRSHRDRPGEWYVAGFGGVTLGHNFNDVERTGAGAGLNQEDIGLKNSVVYGGKIGYFLPDRLNWLGFEAEGFNTTPHFEQQGSVPGSHLRVTTAAFNVVARAQLACDDDRTDRSDIGGRSRGTSPERDNRGLCHFQPYVGVGPGVFFARASNNGTSSSDNGVVGFNAVAGVRYFFTEHVALFGEYKYNRATFEFDAVAGGGGLTGDYSASHVVGGLSFHF